MAKTTSHLRIIFLINLYLLYSHAILTVGFDDQLRTTAETDLRVGESSGRFKISVFADLHFGENAWTDWGPRQDVKSLRVMSTVLEHESPGNFSS